LGFTKIEGMYRLSDRSGSYISLRLPAEGDGDVAR
jgi:hypothetical protein